MNIDFQLTTIEGELRSKVCAKLSREPNETITFNPCIETRDMNIHKLYINADGIPEVVCNYHGKEINFLFVELYIEEMIAINNTF